jgi:hypothetical protein
MEGHKLARSENIRAFLDLRKEVSEEAKSRVLTEKRLEKLLSQP